jgi:hypothetical protein
VMERAFRET